MSFSWVMVNLFFFHFHLKKLYLVGRLLFSSIVDVFQMLFDLQYIQPQHWEFGCEC
jgi:hypothetical protein